ncbi:MAG: hypothetical protein AAFU67_15025, partial [Bacteroidota bacterium]
ANQFLLWRDDLAEDTAGLQATILGLIETNLRDQVIRLVGAINAAGRWGYRSPISVAVLSAKEAYNLSPLQTFAVDANFIGRRGSIKNKVLAAKEQLADIYRVFWKSLEATVQTAQNEQNLEASLRNPSRHNEPPHLGLVFSFLLLFRDIQGNLNNLSEKHLDFFYRQTLRLKELPHQNDQAHLVFELGKQVEESVRLEKGLRLKAGKDEAGTEIIFALNDEVILTKTQVADVRTMHLGSSKLEVITDIHAAPMANSGDGLGGDFPKDVPAAWPTVGATQAVFSDPETEEFTTLPQAELGLVAASPVLFLREGKRKITVTITFKGSCLKMEDFTGAGLTINSGGGPGVLAPTDATPANLLLLPFLSTEEGWSPVSLNSEAELNQIVNSGPVAPTSGEFISEWVITMELPVDFPAIIYPGDDNISPTNPSQYPQLKLELNKEIARRGWWYCQFGLLAIADIKIDVEVCDVRQLVLQNDLALIDPAKPFQPFGPIPKKNSSNFYVGSEEVFVKNWSQINLKWQWLDKPDNL